MAARTTEPEDMAYGLLGIFEVHISRYMDTTDEKQMRDDLAIKFLACTVRPSSLDFADFGVGALERI
jgi:hypothetical protein